MTQVTQIRPITPQTDTPGDKQSEATAAAAAQAAAAHAAAHAPPKLPFQVKSPLVRECLSEFLCSFVFISFGLGVNAQVILSKAAAGSFLSVTLGWGVAVMMGMHVGGGVSHSHMNPAITLTLAFYRVFPWTKVPGYLLSQVLGAFVGSLMVYTMYYPIIDAADPDKTVSATIFHTHPHPLVTNGTAFFTEFCATGLVMICLLALTDEKNRSTVVPSFPGCVACLTAGIGMSFSMISSAALNPARDLGPRIMLSVVGYKGVFTAHHYYFWIPLVAPTLGAVVGAAIYLVFILGHHPAVVNNKGFF